MVHFLLSVCAEEEEVVFTADPPGFLLPGRSLSLSHSYIQGYGREEDVLFQF